VNVCGCVPRAHAHVGKRGCKQGRAAWAAGGVKGRAGPFASGTWGGFGSKLMFPAPFQVQDTAHGRDTAYTLASGADRSKPTLSSSCARVVARVSTARCSCALPHTMQPGRGGGLGTAPMSRPVGARLRPDQVTRSKRNEVLHSEGRPAEFGVFQG
jgi:hypothetical protein